MEKQETLEAVKQLAAGKQITRREVLDAYDSGAAQTGTAHRALGLSGILYYVGGAIVFLGVAILIYQNWDVLSGFTKIVATLGIAVAAFVAGCVLRRDARTAAASEAMFLISGLVAPVGAFVLIDQLGADPSTPFNQLAVAAALFFLFFAAYYLIKKTVLEFFAFAFATALLFTIVSFMTSTAPGADYTSVYEYTFLAAGAAYMAFGWWYTQTGRALAGALNGFGVLFFLGAALALGGYSPHQNAFWETIMPVLALGVMFVSVKLRSQAYLVLGAIALMGYILKVTGEYFSGSLGWPVALMVAGLLLIAVGYYSVRIRHRFGA
jgi:hypothetical protein